MQIESGDVRVSFTNIGSGLVIIKGPWVTAEGQPLATRLLVDFTIAGADQKGAFAEIGVTTW